MMNDPSIPREKPKRQNLVDELATLFRSSATIRPGALRLEPGKSPAAKDDSVAAPFETFPVEEITPPNIELTPDIDTPASAPVSLVSLVAGIDDRMRRQAAPASAERRMSGTAQNRYIVFNLGPTTCAFPLRSVAEIGRMTKTTPVPKTPPWVAGLTNLRGEILSVADLRLFLGFSPSPGREVMMVARSTDNEVVAALLVDRVTGLARLPEDRISPVPVDFQGELAPYLAGLAEHADAVLAVFDPDRLLLSPRFLNLE